MTAIIIASCDINPFVNLFMLKANPNVIIAIINALPEPASPAINEFTPAISKAVGIRFTPITIIIGPTTCAGKILLILDTPIFFIINETTT